MHQLKETLRLVGIDVSIFSGHSVRDTSTSAAVEAGITMADIGMLSRVFRRFYYRSTHNVSYGRTVLSFKMLLVRSNHW